MSKKISRDFNFIQKKLATELLFIIISRKMNKTTLSAAVKKTFELSKEPLSVPQIMENLNSQNLFPNKTTVYRIVEKLTKKGELELIISQNRTAFYELKRHNHHHLVCQNCESIHCIEDEDIEKTIHDFEHELKKKRLKVNIDQLSFSTTNCQACL